MSMTLNKVIGIPVLILVSMLFFIPDNGLAYDQEVYDKINSSLSCQCGCGLLISVCKMEGCMSGVVREQVGQLLDSGQTEQQVKQALIGVYGKQILAAPPKSGFDLSAYILPFFFLLAGGSVLYSIAMKWKQNSIPVSDNEVTDSNEQLHQDARHQNRIEQELKDFDK